MQVPDLCKGINKDKVLNNCIKYLNRTHIMNNQHSKCVCVVCDSYSIGTEQILWLSEEMLKAKESYLSVQYLESVVEKIMPPDLRNHYKIDNNKTLSSLLLSPRAHKNYGNYMACKACYQNIISNTTKYPP